MNRQSIMALAVQTGIHTAASRITDKWPPDQVRDDTEKGNALFLILIAVALFAALSYAVTQSNRSGGSIDREEAIIQAGEILNYMALAKSAIMRMQVVNGCADDEISFASSGWPGSSDVSGYFYNDAYRHAVLATPPADQRCHFFAPSGGGVDFRSNPEWHSPSASSYYRETPYFTGHARIKGIGQDIGPAAVTSELLIVIPFVSKAICEVINRKIGIEPPPPIVPLIALNERFGFRQYGVNPAIWVDSSDVLANQRTACFEGLDHINAPGGLIGSYHAYHVLIAR